MFSIILLQCNLFIFLYIYFLQKIKDLRPLRELEVECEGYSGDRRTRERLGGVGENKLEKRQ